LYPPPIEQINPIAVGTNRIRPGWGTPNKIAPNPVVSPIDHMIATNPVVSPTDRMIATNPVVSPTDRVIATNPVFNSIWDDI
jgi:hypothetical protein